MSTVKYSIENIPGLQEILSTLEKRIETLEKELNKSKEEKSSKDGNLNSK